MASNFQFCSSETNDLIISECGANYVISASDSGYQTQETFEGFVRDNLIKELDLKGVIRNAQNPIVYFLDGHKSHYIFKFEDMENAKILANEEKEQKKLERKERKEQNEVIKNIKKEKAEEKKAAKRKQLEQHPEINQQRNAEENRKQPHEEIALKLFLMSSSSSF